MASQPHAAAVVNDNRKRFLIPRKTPCQHQSPSNVYTGPHTSHHYRRTDTDPKTSPLCSMREKGSREWYGPTSAPSFRMICSNRDRQLLFDIESPKHWYRLTTDGQPNGLTAIAQYFLLRMSCNSRMPANLLLSIMTCADISKANDITITQLLAWNSVINSDCHHFARLDGTSRCISSPGMPYVKPATATYEYNDSDAPV